MKEANADAMTLRLSADTWHHYLVDSVREEEEEEEMEEGWGLKRVCSWYNPENILFITF